VHLVSFHLPHLVLSHVHPANLSKPASDCGHGVKNCFTPASGDGKAIRMLYPVDMG
jgi:hypothetical protein